MLASFTERTRQVFPPGKSAIMKENDVIAIIIIILFIVLALIAFGIYRLVHMARNQGSITTTSSTGSSESELVG